MTPISDTRDELIEKYRKTNPPMTEDKIVHDELDDDFFVFTITVRQRKKIIDVLIKIAIGLVLVIAGYFLPH